MTKIILKMSETIGELQELSDKGFYTRSKIVWWLIKYEKPYKECISMIDILKIEFPNANLWNYKSLIRRLTFMELYESLEKIADNPKNINNKKIELKSIIKKFKETLNGNNRKIKINK